MSTNTDSGNGKHSPLSDMSSENSNDMFGYKNAVSLHQHTGAGKHQVITDDRSNTKLAKHTSEQAHGQSLRDEITEQTITNLQRALNSSNQRSPVGRSDAWPFDDPTMDPDAQDPVTAGYRHSTIWGASHKSSITQLPPMPLPSPGEIQFNSSISRNTSMDHGDYFGPSRGGWSSNRRSSSFQPGPAGPPITAEARMYSRRPSFNSGSGASGFSRPSFDYSIPGHQQSPSTSYTPSPIGTPLSPTATEFTASSGASAAVWNSHGHV